MASEMVSYDKCRFILQNLIEVIESKADGSWFEYRYTGYHSWDTKQ